MVPAFLSSADTHSTVQRGTKVLIRPVLRVFPDQGRWGDRGHDPAIKEGQWVVKYKFYLFLFTYPLPTCPAQPTGHRACLGGAHKSARVMKGKQVESALQTRTPPFQASGLSLAAGRSDCASGAQHPTMAEFASLQLRTSCQAGKALLGRALVVMWSCIKTSTCPFMMWEWPGPLLVLRQRGCIVIGSGRWTASWARGRTVW